MHTHSTQWLRKCSDQLLNSSNNNSTTVQIQLASLVQGVYNLRLEPLYRGHRINRKGSATHICIHVLNLES